MTNGFPQSQPTYQIPPTAPDNANLAANLNSIVSLSNLPAMPPPTSTLDSGMTAAMASILATAQAAIAAYKPT